MAEDTIRKVIEKWAENWDCCQMWRLFFRDMTGKVRQKAMTTTLPLRFSAGAIFYFVNCKAMAGQRTKNKISSIYLHPAKLLQRCRNIYHRKAVFVLESLHIYSLVVKLLQPLRLRKYFSLRRWISKIDSQYRRRKVAAKKANSNRTNRFSKLRTAERNFKIAPLKNRENGLQVIIYHIRVSSLSSLRFQ